jgi:predicted ester cyclase
MNTDTTRRLLEDQILRLWGAGRTELVAANYAPDIIDHMPVPGQAAGLDGMAQVVRDFRTGLPDLQMTLEATIVNGEHGCDLWTLRATNDGPLFGREPTGRRVEMSGIDMIRVRDGQIAELWHVEEMLQMEAQLGHEPQDFGAPSSEYTPAPTGPYDPGANAWTPDPATLTALERRNLAIAREHIEEIWAKGRHDVAYRIYAPEVVDRNPAPGQRPGIDGIVDVLGWLREAVPDLRMSINAYLVEGSLAADRWTMTGTHTGGPLMGLPPRGRPFRINGMDVSHIREDGLIDWVFHVEEFAQLRAQIA